MKVTFGTGIVCGHCGKEIDVEVNGFFRSLFVSSLLNSVQSRGVSSAICERCSKVTKVQK